MTTIPTTLVTGSAGFIGYHVSKRLLQSGHTVVGFDNLNDYYDVGLKQARIANLQEFNSQYIHVQADLGDRQAVESTFETHRPDKVVNLAAQAGVRYAAENPHVYVQSNLTGFLHILEGCRHFDVQHLVYASTSSVYGANTSMPFSEHHSTEHPLTLYAATKKANEMMAHSYAHLYGFPCTGLRFFTVYGPWYRPDMALFKFTKAILAGEPIPIFNHGHHKRSFTYIDDIVEGIVRVLDQPARPDPDWSSDQPDPARSNAPYRLFNIGSATCLPLMRYIEILEAELGIKAKKNMLPLQAGDVPATASDVQELAEATGHTPSVTVEEGIHRFVKWYKEYYEVS